MKSPTRCPEMLEVENFATDDCGECDLRKFIRGNAKKLA
jgi:hypothetical protein